MVRGSDFLDFTILECKRFIAASGKCVQRRINHYELDFYVGGIRQIEIDGRKSEISGGCICFRRPGQLACSTGDYDCFVSTLDFSGKADADFFGRQIQSACEPEFRHELIDDIPDVFKVYHKNEILSRFMYISDLADCKCESARLAMTEILFLINADICRERLGRPQENDTPTGRLIKYINTNYRENIGLDTLAALVNLDKSYMIRLFKASFGVSPIEYLIDLRLNHARTLLVNTDMTVGEIAAECGYNSSSFFVSSFGKKFGCTPGAYRTVSALENTEIR